MHGALSSVSTVVGAAVARKTFTFTARRVWGFQPALPGLSVIEARPTDQSASGLRPCTGARMANRPAAGMPSGHRPVNELDCNGQHAAVRLPHHQPDQRSRVAADQIAHGWSASRGRYMLSQQEQRAFEQQVQQANERAVTAPQTHNFDGLQQRAALRAQPVGGRLQYGRPQSGSHLEERAREYGVSHFREQERLTTEQVLREEQRQERQEAEERRQRAQAARAAAEAAERAERRQYQEQYERVLHQRWRSEEAARQQPFQRAAPHAPSLPGPVSDAWAWRAQPRELRAGALATKEARVVDWIRGGNPWAEQGWVADQHGKSSGSTTPPARGGGGGGEGAAAGAMASAHPQPRGSSAGNAFESPGMSFRSLSRRTPTGALAAYSA